MKGFTLLIAVVLAAVAVSVTLALTTFGYKSLLLSSASKESQYAFYAADAALECALFYDSGNPASQGDQHSFPFDSSPGNPSITCAGQTVNLTGTYASGETKYITSSSNSGWFSIHDNRCARFTVYKDTTTARIYAEGTNVACSDLSNPRAIVRAIKAVY